MEHADACKNLSTQNRPWGKTWGNSFRIPVDKVVRVQMKNPQGIHRFSAASIKHIDEPGWHADGGGL